jgi:hypothetical protein
MPSPYFGIPDVEYNACVNIVTNAINDWHNLVVTVAAENVAMGITQQNKTKLVADTLMPIMLYGSTGSLMEAYLALNDIVITPDMAPYITPDRVIWMQNELMKIMQSL